MLTLEIRLLTGRYAAGRHDDASIPEWPPHPARLYSALTAAIHEWGERPTHDERSALEWLAGAGAPDIIASGAHQRHLGDVFVPVNDSRGLDSIDRYLTAAAEATAALGGAPDADRRKAQRTADKHEKKLRERSAASATKSRMAPATAAELLDRPRHPRRFPVVLPHRPVVRMQWPSDPPELIRTSLDRICGRVSRLGHPSSLVAVRVAENEVDDGPECVRWAVDPNGDIFIRVPHDDQLALLEAAYVIHRGTKERVLPARDERYAVAGRSIATVQPHSEFASADGEWLVYELVPPPGGDRKRLVDASLTQQITRALRGTLLAALDGDAPEAVSGHGTDGRPAERTHVAFLALADVGHQYATGSILGVAIVPPRSLRAEDRRRLLEGVFRAERADGSEEQPGDGGRIRLTLGRDGVLHLRRRTEPSRLRTLRVSRWCGPARRWATTTAIALDRNPGKLGSRDSRAVEQAISAAERTVVAACVRIGLPEPAAVWVHRRSLLSGAPAAKRFAPYPAGGDGPRRVCVHAEVLFDQPVLGPVLLGAGRYFGLGLAAPYDPRRARHR